VVQTVSNRVLIWNTEDAMTKDECKTELKHQIKISRRLKEVGMYTAATASRKKAQILLHAYKLHLLKESS
jgi:hypothetical protein